jgi:hypothetical protein
MPLNPPDRLRLLDAVIGVIAGEGTAPAADTADYDRRIAVALLRIVRREIDAAEFLCREEQARLAALLGAEADLVSLNARLCELIRSRGIGLETPALLDHLRRTTLAKLSIDNPRYPAYQRALGATPRR